MIEFLCRHGEQRARFHRQAPKGVEVDYATPEARRVDRSGHANRSLVSREIVNVRLREAVDLDVAGAHAKRTGVVKSGSVEHGIERG